MHGVERFVHAHAKRDELERQHLHPVQRFEHDGLRERRRAGGIERSFQRAIGFDKKIEQYDAGERFVREVVSRAGMDGLNRVWLAPEGLPTVEEIAEPPAWVARVAGS